MAPLEDSAPVGALCFENLSVVEGDERITCTALESTDALVALDAPTTDSKPGLELQTAALVAAQQQQQQEQAVEVASAATPGTGSSSSGLSDDTPALDACVLAFWDLYTQAQLPAAISLFQDYCEANHVPQEAFASRLAAMKSVDLASLLARAAAVDKGIQSCLSDEGWTLVRDDNLRLLYRHTPGSTVHCFKGACLLPAPLTHVLAMAREFDLVKTWNSYITVSDVIAVNCQVDIAAYCAVWVPWPMAERDVFIQAVGVDHLDDLGALAVSFGSPPGGKCPAGAALPAGYGTRTHVSLQDSSCLLLTPLAPATPDGPTHTQAVVTGFIETGMAYIPEALITFVLRTLAPFVYNAVLKTLAGAFGSDADPLPSRMRQRPELYELLERRVREHLSKQAGSSSSRGDR